jgi:predicted small integral membrane protein
MILRLAKLSLVFAVALFYTLLVFDNLTDYDSNYQFVRHVLMMDSTFPGNHLMWRALNAPAWHTCFYVTIIFWELVVMVLCWGGVWRLFRAISKSNDEFDRAKALAIAAMALGMLQWLIAFIIVGGEWFQMWQSKTWNGEDAAFRMFTVLGVALLLLMRSDSAGSTSDNVAGKN